MKIVLFANTDWYLYNFRLAFMERLKEFGHEIILLSPSGPYGPNMAKLGFRWVELPMRRASLDPLTELRLIAFIARVYRRERPDLVHHFTIKCVVYGSLAAKIAGIRNRINAVAGLGTVFVNRGYKARLLKPFVRALLKLALQGAGSHLIVQNPDDRTMFEKNRLIPVDRIHLVRGSGVDGRRFQANAVRAHDEVCRILFASRLLWDKGVGRFIDAARALEGQAEFLIAGTPDDGNPDSIDIRFLESCRRQGIVDLLGHVPDMPRLLHEIDVLVLPSIYGEGVPRILVEGAACGLPLVAFDVPGSREIVVHGENGFLIPPGDEHALVESLRRLIGDPELRKRMGAHSRRHFESEYDLETVFSKTLDVYRICLQSD